MHRFELFSTDSSNEAPVYHTLPSKFIPGSRPSIFDSILSKPCDVDLISSTIALTGPTFSRQTAPIDFFKPKFQSYNFPPNGPVQHLDVCATWIGISNTNAEELSHWETAFRLCFLRELTRFFINTSFKANDEGFHTLRIHLPFLVTEMVYELNSQGLVSDGVDISRLSRTKSIYSALTRFVRLHDCFDVYDSSLDQILVAPFRFDRQCSLIEANWRPPYLSFEGIDSPAIPGRVYCLKPQVNYPGEPEYARSVNFSTSCDWLGYDPLLVTLYGVVPELQADKELVLTVKASVIAYFGGNGARHEHVIRVRVRVPVVSRRLSVCTTIDNLPSPVPGSVKSGDSFEDFNEPLILRRGPDNPFCVEKDTQCLSPIASTNPFATLAIRTDMDHPERSAGPDDSGCDKSECSQSRAEPAKQLLSPISEPYNPFDAFGEAVAKARAVNFDGMEDPRDIEDMREQLVELELQKNSHAHHRFWSGTYESIFDDED